MPGDGTKKRKRDLSGVKPPKNGIDTTKPTAIFKPAKGRSYTISLALPGSVIANAQTHDLKTSLCGSIARALAVFCVDEIVIFDDSCNDLYQHHQTTEHAAKDAKTGYSAYSDPNGFLQHLLSYLETPPPLRRALFGFHPNLRTAGSLPSLDIPSHLREHEWCQYREGVTIDAVTVDGGQTKESKSKKQGEIYVQAGLQNPIRLSPLPAASIPPNTRVTLRFSNADSAQKDQSAEAVDPALPREQGGYYWGYTTRIASSLTNVFIESPFESGYDYSIGMSERGMPLRDLLANDGSPDEDLATEPISRAIPPGWNHLLIVFGGPTGLEAAVENDAVLAAKGVTNASILFDAWVNLVEGQGSRTIRTEEALWIGLMGCREIVRRRKVENEA